MKSVMTGNRSIVATRTQQVHHYWHYMACNKTARRRRTSAFAWKRCDRDDDRSSA